MINFIFYHYLFVIGACLICFIIGARITINFKYHSFLERFTISTSLGMGVIALLIFFIGLLKGLYGRVLVPVIFILVLTCIITWPGLLKIKIDRANLKTILKRFNSTNAIWIGIVVIAVLFTYLLPLYPPTVWDSIEYHLAVAKIYTRAHAIVFTPYLRYPVVPQLNHMLFVGAFIVYDDISAQLIEYAMFILIACGLYAFSRRHFSSWVGIIASALWLGSPLAVFTGSIGYIDIGLTLFAFMGVYSFINFYQTNEHTWLWLSGIFLGFAAATKYTGLFFVLLCGLILLWLSFKRRDFRIPVKFAIAVIMVAIPFYIRDAYYSGNPFFPYLSNIFPQRIWNTVDAASLATEQGWYGLPKTARSLVTLPYYLVFKPDLFMSELADRLPFSPLYFMAFPLILLMFFIRKTRIMNLFTASFTLFWFGTVQIIRYLLPVFPLLSITTAIFIEFIFLYVKKLLSGWNKFEIHSRFFNPVVFSVFSLVLLLPIMKYGQDINKNYGLLPVTSWDRAAFLQWLLPTYPAYRTLNAMVGDNYTIYALQDANMAYFANGTFMGDWFGPARYSMVTEVLSDDARLYQVLRQLKADYFLINVQVVKDVPKVLFNSQHFHIVDQTNDYILFGLIIPP